jgi:hypothetical protein
MMGSVEQTREGGEHPVRYSRNELLEIITPHVLRTVVRLQGSVGETVTADHLVKAGLSDEQRQALVQTKRLVESEDGVYRINLQA